MKKVCVATATRAEYGLLKPVIQKICEADTLELQLLVTGAHLSPEFGLTYKEIEEDGYPITEKIEMLLSSDTKVGITKSMAVALMGFADFFERCKPDMVVLLGDRYETLMIATAALIAKIPIAHIHGGEVTEGAYDDAIRHSITKMSQLHFASTEVYRNRIIQLGETPDRVYNVGALGVENIKSVTFWTKAMLERDLQISLDKDTVIVTYHPVTLDDMSAREQFTNLLQVLDEYSDIQVIFTKANADTDGRVINHMIDEYVKEHNDRCVAFASLGQVRYLSVLAFCRAVVGNSSSGIVEAPSFHVPTIDIGNRQKGRIAASSVIHCGYESTEIKAAFERALSAKFRLLVRQCTNPYEGVNTSQRIVDKIAEALGKSLGVKKEFYDMKADKREVG